MSNIRRLNISDKSQLKKIAGLSSINSDYFKYHLLKECACSIQSLLPLRLKFMPESFVYDEDLSIKGMISVRSTRGNNEQINITRLLFENNDYQIGKGLIDFIIRHYGEQGAKNFKVIIENNHKELEDLFIRGCGFRCGSWENLWDITRDIKRFKRIEPAQLTTAHDEHAHEIAELCNNELIPYYRPTLEHSSEEFKDPILKIFDNKYENSYVLIDNKKLLAYLTIQTNDNYNFIITLTANSGYPIDYDGIIAFALKSIRSRRSSRYKAYIKQQKNLKFAQNYEEYLHAQNYKCIQTQHILVKDFYKPVKQEYQAFVFGENKLLSN